MTIEEMEDRFLFPVPRLLGKSDRALVTLIRLNEHVACRQQDAMPGCPRDEEIDYAQDHIEQCIAILTERGAALPPKLEARLLALFPK